MPETESMRLGTWSEMWPRKLNDDELQRGKGLTEIVGTIIPYII